MSRYLAARAWLGGDGELARDVAIDVDGGVITGVEAGASDEHAERLEGMVVPGLVSAHSHTFHRTLRGRTHAQGGDFWTWRDAMFAEAARLEPDSYRQLAIQVFGEMLAAGITTAGEFHYLHHRPDAAPYDDPNAMGMSIVEAALDTGIRLTLIDACYLTADLHGTPPTGPQARFSDASVTAWGDRVRDLAAHIAGLASVRPGVAVHSVRAVPATDLSAVAAIASELGAPLHVHVSEQPAENEACLARHGMTPVELLASTGMLGPSTSLVHATHLTGDDLGRIAGSGAGVCLCPTTEADLGDGIGPAHEMTEAGIPLSLGSDSNAVVDMFEEARRVEHHDRLRLRRRGVHSPVALLAAATTGGAASLGWPEAGRIAPGAAADLVVLDPNSHDLAGTPPTPASIVMAATRAAVTDVMVAGRWRVRSADRQAVAR